MTAGTEVGSDAGASASRRPPLALVSGAQRGIGLAIARAFALAGHDVVIADLDAARKGSALGIDWGVATRIDCLVCDVGDEDAVETLFGDVESRTGRAPDVLVNNAAVQFWGPLVDSSLADWETTLRVNLTGPYLLTRRFARARIAAGGGGAIVNIGSGCNRLAFPELAGYVASKGGVEMLTKASALELGAHGIRVNCIAPGAIETERTRAETDGYAERWAPLTPLGRVGTVDDVARAVVALAGEGMGCVSGETIAVDGGLFGRAIWPRDY